MIRAKRQKFRIAEIPIKSFPTRESRLFKGPIQYAVKAWINILRIYRDFDPLKFFGYLGGFIFFVGFGLGLFVLWHLVSFGNVGGIPRVILSAVLVLAGIQIMLFGFLADMVKR